MKNPGFKPTWWWEKSDNAFARGMTKGDVIMDWLRRNKVESDSKGRYRFFHGTPKPVNFEVLNIGSLLATSPSEAAHYASRDRDLKSEDVVVFELWLFPTEINVGVFASTRDYNHIEYLRIVKQDEIDMKKNPTSTWPDESEGEHYNYYLVHKQDGTLHGGFESKQDAVDASKDHHIPKSELKVVHRSKIGPDAKEQYHRANKIMSKLYRNPLVKGQSRKVISKNIKTLMHEGYAQKQAVAIAFKKAGLSYTDGSKASLKAAEKHAKRMNPASKRSLSDELYFECSFLLQDFDWKPGFSRLKEFKKAVEQKLARIVDKRMEDIPAPMFKSLVSATIKRFGKTDDLVTASEKLRGKPGIREIEIVSSDVYGDGDGDYDAAMHLDDGWCFIGESKHSKMFVTSSPKELVGAYKKVKRCAVDHSKKNPKSGSKWTKWTKKNTYFDSFIGLTRQEFSLKEKGTHKDIVVIRGLDKINKFVSMYPHHFSWMSRPDANKGMPRWEKDLHYQAALIEHANSSREKKNPMSYDRFDESDRCHGCFKRGSNPEEATYGYGNDLCDRCKRIAYVISHDERVDSGPSEEFGNIEPGKPDWWVYLKNGWITDSTDSHTIHEQSLPKVYEVLSRVPREPNEFTPEKKNPMSDGESKIEFLLDGSRGIYLPRDFAKSFDIKSWGLSAEDVSDLSDPEGEHYWEAWDDVLTKAVHTDADGQVWYLMQQDGDLFAIRDDYDQVEMANPRKVSTEMTKLFFSGKSGKMGNTSTRDGKFFLHGNEIAHFDENGDLWISDAGWPTVTTRERLNTILRHYDAERMYGLGLVVGVYQSKNKQYIDISDNVYSQNSKSWDGDWFNVSDFVRRTADLLNI